MGIAGIMRAVADSPSWQFVSKTSADPAAFGRLVFVHGNALVNGDFSQGLDGDWRRLPSNNSVFGRRQRVGHVVMAGNFGWQVRDQGPHTRTVTFPEARTLVGVGDEGLSEHACHYLTPRAVPIRVRVEVLSDGNNG